MYPVKYDPETGILVWQPRVDVPAWWNGKYAGKPCGSAHNGYLRMDFNGKPHLVHRVIWFITYGYWPHAIDHINGDKMDNRLENLREVTPLENMKNQKKRHDSQYGPGVRSTRNGKWQARIGANGKHHIGTFDTIEEAVRARQEAERSHGYHENHGR